MSILRFAISLFFVFTVSSCVTRLPMPAGVPDISETAYEALVIKKSKKIEVYDGLYNKLTVNAIWIDSEMSEGYLAHSARLAQWQEPFYREEKNKLVMKHSGSTEFFVSFYTPERRHADLSQSKALWKIYLDVNGQRYEGKATKVKGLLSEIQASYPSHNRWSVPYMISFPVATAITENKPAILTFTGAVSTAQIKY
ncbi:MAG: hypothetical protein H7256_03900 [Bdellovibrio sp.]|nr:hypothetical protein [Bdellovibrio sp.]